ncbi:hypothetical protein J4449_03315 [Candidatus Woesearchaeota archaeon]|nr:hypothetical protein [Candidatus Woesearchaeota archaeon]
MQETKEVIMIRFLRKLMNLNMWGGKHTEEKNLLKALPKHLRGEKVTDEAMKELYKLEFLSSKPSTGELHISLNSRKKKEICEFLEKHKS